MGSIKNIVSMGKYQLVKGKPTYKTIGIYTKNFKLYHDLVNSLKKRNISYVSLTSLQHIPHRIGVIITSHASIHEVNTPKVIAADAYESIDHAIEKAMNLLIGKELYHTIYIGIDPGEKPGIAVVGDDILIVKTQVKSPENVCKNVKRFIKEYPAHEYLLRIGHGSLLIRNRIINSLIPLQIPIEIVDESKTTSSQQTQRAYRDSEAAAAIAMLKGGRVQRQLPLKPTRGAIRNIQEKSRQMTNGRFSITQQQARNVLEGKMSLQEAIKKEKK
jgi:hypothetical protein